MGFPLAVLKFKFSNRTGSVKSLSVCLTWNLLELFFLQNFFLMKIHDYNHIWIKFWNKPLTFILWHVPWNILYQMYLGQYTVNIKKRYWIWLHIQILFSRPCIVKRVEKMLFRPIRKKQNSLSFNNTIDSLNYLKCKI
jgi:hypothetical protein